MGRIGFIRSILTKCESLRDNLIAYAFEESNGTGTHKWISVCVSDYDLYYNDRRFKALTHAWHTVARKKGFKIVFFWCVPKEKNLVELASQDNLIMNI